MDYFNSLEALSQSGFRVYFLKGENFSLVTAIKTKKYSHFG